MVRKLLTGIGSLDPMSAHDKMDTVQSERERNTNHGNYNKGTSGVANATSFATQLILSKD